MCLVMHRGVAVLAVGTLVAGPLIAPPSTVPEIGHAYPLHNELAFHAIDSDDAIAF